MARQHPKQHATNPRWVRVKRNELAKLRRAEKAAERVARAEARRAGVILLPGPDMTLYADAG